MIEPLSIVWRGPLDSCNYTCSYCPFAKRAARADVLRDDRMALERFVQWVVSHPDRPLRILFTPWGEGMVHAWYRSALAQLSRCAHVERVGIQTNGSASWHWLAQADVRRLGLWISWHPDQIDLETFLAGLAPALDAQVPCTVGGVAIPERVPDFETLRTRLPSWVSMWLNARQPLPTYTAEMVARCAAIDPSFHRTFLGST